MGKLGVLIRNTTGGTKQGPLALVFPVSNKDDQYNYCDAYMWLQMREDTQGFPTSSYRCKQLVGQPTQS